MQHYLLVFSSYEQKLQSSLVLSHFLIGFDSKLLVYAQFASSQMQIV